MSNEEKKSGPYLHVRFGEDGNPEIEAAGSNRDLTNLCTALVAGMAAMYGAGDIATYITDMMMAAAELVDRMEGAQ